MRLGVRIPPRRAEKAQVRAGFLTWTLCCHTPWAPLWAPSPIWRAAGGRSDGGPGGCGDSARRNKQWQVRVYAGRDPLSGVNRSLGPEHAPHPARDGVGEVRAADGRVDQAQPVRSMPAGAVLSRVATSFPRSSPVGSGSTATMSTSPAATSRGRAEAPAGAGSGSMMNSSGQTVSWTCCPAPAHDVVDVARLKPVQRT
jgi:hypothetical protein